MYKKKGKNVSFLENNTMVLFTVIFITEKIIANKVNLRGNFQGNRSDGAKDLSTREKKDLTYLSYNDSYWPRSLVCYSVPFATRRRGGDFRPAERAHGVSRAKHLRHHGNSALGDTLGLPAQTTELPRQPLSSSHHFVQGMYTNLE